MQRIRQVAWSRVLDELSTRGASSADAVAAADPLAHWRCSSSLVFSARRLFPCSSVKVGGAAGGTVGGVIVGHRQTRQRQRLDLHVTGQRPTTRGYVQVDHRGVPAGWLLPERVAQVCIDELVETFPHVADESLVRHRLLNVQRPTKISAAVFARRQIKAHGGIRPLGPER
jgi:hypothetical protein